MIFNPNTLALEEKGYLGTLRMDELHRIFKSYEMRVK
jgi:hypothetical protein